MTKVVVVNGPNLGRLGVRQPDVYGKQDLETCDNCAPNGVMNWGLTWKCVKATTSRDDSLDASAADEKRPIRH